MKTQTIRSTNSIYVPPRPPDSRALWGRLDASEAAFVAAYLRTSDATKAYDSLTVTPVAKSGAEILRHKRVRAVLATVYAARVERMEINADTVVRELGKIAFSDVREYLDDAGNLQDLSTISDNAAGALASLELSVERDRDGEELSTTKKLKLWDKVAALREISKILGMHITKTQDVTRGGTFNVIRHLPAAPNPLYE